MAQLAARRFVAGSSGKRGLTSHVVEEATRFARSRKESARAAAVFEQRKFNLAAALLALGSVAGALALLDKLQCFLRYPEKPPGASDIPAIEKVVSTPGPARLITKRMQPAGGASGVAFPALRMVREV